MVRTSGVTSGPRRTSTRAEMEQTVVWGFVGIRVFSLAQAVVSMLSGSLAKSTNPTLDWLFLAGVLVESALVSWWFFKRRSVFGATGMALAEFGVALLALGSSVAYVPADSRLSVWTLWAYPVTLSTTALLGASLRRWPWILAGSAALAAAYFVVVALPLSGNPSRYSTAVVNAMAYLNFAIVAWFFTRFTRRLADAADHARARVAELERENSKAIVHDLLPYLRLEHLADADEETRTAIVAQARTAHDQMRSFVDGTQELRGAEGCLQAVLDLHRRLTIRPIIDLERGLDLPEEVLTSLRQAVETALCNVEQHAPGASVVLSARSELDHLEVVVRDDGPGFDPKSVRPGFGIGAILGRQLQAVGGTGTVTSAPGGGGTEVCIRVPREQP